MKPNLLLVFCFIGLFLSVPGMDADAQFWKKKNSRPVKKKAAPTKPRAETVKPKKPRVLDYPTSRIKSRYRVDILIPLYLDELIVDDKPAFKDRLPEKVQSGYNFYEGIQLAIDTLNALGYNLDVHIHDVSQEKLSPENLIKYKALVGSDLIIGALSSSQIPPIADYSKKSKINFISAISPADADVRNNPFFSIMQPTLRTHCEKMRQEARKRFPGKITVPVIGRTGSSQDSAALNYVLQGQDKTLSKYFWYADSILQYLGTYYPGYEFQVFGMPTWRTLNSTRKSGSLPSIQVMFSTPFNYESSSPSAQAVAAHYKKKFYGRPSEMVFRGYETLYWCAYLLQKYGTVFNNRLGDTGGAAFTPFDLKAQWTADNDLLYLENEYAYMYIYQGGSYTIQK
ncbi:MAG: amino acid ABC transporter substrate-binding protein [Sphingobacteriales bacterium]|nr:MAG: amino acid ABC transporter substrate-binding protein [Sphingobacteriales bacterium]